VQAVLQDHHTAPISEKEKALFTFIEAVNRSSKDIGQPEVDTVKAAGWDDEAIYDAITVCALFNFLNIWVDATGVSDMPEAAYLAGGERMAKRGYVPPSMTGESS